MSGPSSPDALPSVAAPAAPGASPALHKVAVRTKHPTKNSDGKHIGYICAGFAFQDQASTLDVTAETLAVLEANPHLLVRRVGEHTDELPAARKVGDTLDGRPQIQVLQEQVAKLLADLEKVQAEKARLQQLVDGVDEGPSPRGPGRPPSPPPRR